MHNYGMGYREVMDLPIRTFWLLNSNVGRLHAEVDLRAITIQTGRHGGERMDDIRKHLIIEMGDVGKTAESPLEAVRDEGAFNELKALATLM